MNDNPTKLGPAERYAFGKNWASFLAVLDDERILEAEKSLRSMLGMDSLAEKNFLDVGSGSGLFSLAARRLGARVHSFDFDQDSVGCTRYLQQQYFPDDPHWQIDTASALDRQYLARLGQFDIVYSWGVLHHTGEMWRGMENVASLVRDGGHLYISIYNDQGLRSHFWRLAKKRYCAGFAGRALVVSSLLPYLATKDLLRGVVKARGNLFAGFRTYKKARGMSFWHDWHDWLGGYPFEVAKPEEIFDFFCSRNFQLRRLVTCGGGWGCNEFVFKKLALD